MARTIRTIRIPFLARVRVSPVRVSSQHDTLIVLRPGQPAEASTVPNGIDAVVGLDEETADLVREIVGESGETPQQTVVKAIVAYHRATNGK